MTMTPQTYNTQGIELAKQGSLVQAITCFQQALVAFPGYVDAHNNLGIVLKQQGRLEEAIQCYQRAIALDPNYANGHYNLGIALQSQGENSQAIACLRRALELQPGEEDFQFRLGLAFWHLGCLTEAMTCYQRVLQFNPNHAEAHHNLGLVLCVLGEVEQAIEHFQTALRLKPATAIFRNSLSLTMNYAANYDGATIFTEHQKFNDQLALPLAEKIRPHLFPHPRPLSQGERGENLYSTNRKLRIGYVSGDFRRHSVAYFITPILAQHHHEQFEIFCYDNNTVADEINKRLQSYANHWINCSSLSDEELTDRIRHDQIDILVDLSGPTSKNRLLVFARRPAPIQMTYLGYPTTTGLTAIDYRITDKYVDVTGLNDSWNAEVPIQLPTCFFCYQPYADSPPVNNLPMLQTGRITFSSFNNLAKLSPEILRLWAKILNAVPDSTLLIKTRHVSEPAVQQHLEDRFAKFGILPSQLLLEDRTPPPAYLQTYHQVDIALDTYPFNGGLTTCEALWMGIPVVTLVGNRHVSRMGLSILTTLGLTELIAETPEEYLRICLKLVNEVEYLQTLRRELRNRMQSSPLMDAVSFTNNLEKVYLKVIKNKAGLEAYAAMPLS